MCALGNRCYHGECVGGPPTLGCIPGGPQNCSTCAVGLLAGGAFTRDASGQWLAPEGATRGVIADHDGWLIEDPGAAAGLQKGDIVVGIDGIPMTVAWFYLHAFEQGLPKDKRPSSFKLEILRAGLPLVLTLRRS